MNIKDTNIKEVDVSNNKNLIATNMYGNYAGYNVSCKKDVVLKANGEVVKAYK